MTNGGLISKNFSSPLFRSSAEEFNGIEAVNMELSVISTSSSALKQGECVAEKRSAAGYCDGLVEEILKKGGDGRIRASYSKLFGRLLTSTGDIHF